MKKTKPLTPAQKRAATLLATGKNITATAKTVGVTRECLHLWMKLPLFKEYLAESSRAVIEEGIALAGAKFAEAVKTLDEIRRDKSAKDSDRIQAASKLADLTMRGRMESDQLRKLERIEQVLDSNGYFPVEAEGIGEESNAEAGEIESSDEYPEDESISE